MSPLHLETALASSDPVHSLSRAATHPAWSGAARAALSTSTPWSPSGASTAGRVVRTSTPSTAMPPRPRPPTPPPGV
eukprot:CAMPEP_0196688728 /NCGR_PEP_ID=MMETSP1090-20130531/17439_1 /TAXON_ID=37098 /ORGANISM="Isochrysis sp, Strain CCMP1244" /LENGTH=76 /DNA_ID=CAMNT_0042027687 /DNA_START=123 /DNA_END=350 /DNA_ORIENTATION=-